MTIKTLVNKCFDGPNRGWILWVNFHDAVYYATGSRDLESLELVPEEFSAYWLALFGVR